MVVSSVINSVFPARRIRLRSRVQSAAFSMERNIMIFLVFISQPRTIFDSLGVPSPFNFGMLSASAQRRGQVVLTGRNTVCTTSGDAFFPFCTRSAF